MNGTQKILGASYIDKKRMRKKEECGRHWATGVQKARQKVSRGKKKRDFPRFAALANLQLDSA